MMIHRNALNVLAVVMATLAVILLYGMRPAPGRYVPMPDDEAVSEPRLTGKSFIFPGPSVVSPEVFADNFDEVPGVDLDMVIDRLIDVENPGRDVDAVGDKHLTHKAYGLLQIRQPYLDDVNRIAGTSYVIGDMKDPVKARWAAKVYLDHYGRLYERKTRKETTLEVLARIHNGGPNGWRRSSTNAYVGKLSGGAE